MTEPTEVVTEYLRAFNEKDWDRFQEILADDVVEHGVHEELEGPEAAVEFLQGYFEVFPDYTGETEAVVAQDDLVVVRYTAQGTHSDEYHDVDPTAHTVEWSGLSMYRVEDGQIAEIWLEEDRLGLLEQLEAVDPPGHLRV